VCEQSGQQTEHIRLPTAQSRPLVTWRLLQGRYPQEDGRPLSPSAFAWRFNGLWILASAEGPS
jgi:hypothetical protein